MIRNYFIVGWRNARKGRLYSFINVTGLAIGLACSILIALFVLHERSYDTFYSKGSRIYRVNEFFEAENGSGERSSSVPFPVAEAMALDFRGQVEDVVRIFDFQSPALTVAYEPREKIFNERNFFFVDSAFYKLFDLKLVKGNPAEALNNTHSVVLSESTARRYFGEEEPVGKQLLFQGQTDLLVTGVFPDMPANTHFHADFLASFSSLKSFYNGQYPLNWHWNPCWTYVLLKESVKPAELEQHFPDFVRKHFPEFIQNDVRLSLQPLTDIHLRSHLEFEIEPNGSLDTLYLFTGIAIIVLLIAGLNFVNLSTARSMNRAREVGMRKVVGGMKHQLVVQFMVESMIISCAAVVLSIVLVMVVLSFFNSFAETSLHLDLANPMVWVVLASTGLTVGFFSGIYPAIVLTSFNPVKVLKSRHVQGKGFGFRKVLVVLQFVISLVLLIGTGVAVRQVNFLQESSPGFTKDHILMIPVIGTPIAPKYRTFTDRAMTFTGVESITAVEEIVGAKHQGGTYQFEGMENANLFSRLKVRHHFLQTFNIPLLAGRDYSIDTPTDDSLAVVVNETLVRGFGWTAQQAIGKRCQNGRYTAEIIGVARDFNFSSRHEAVGPLVLEMNNAPGAFRLSLKYMAVRLAPGNPAAAVSALEHLWKEFLPGRPFDYFFLDNELDKLYKSEVNQIRISVTFAVLATLVACLGLFGLASFSAEQRQREIGIRTVLGSTVMEMMMLMLTGYLKLLFIAILVALPVAWLAADHWLSGFAYRMNMPWVVFLTASAMITAIALATVSVKSFSAARSNPINALRAE